MWTRKVRLYVAAYSAFVPLIGCHAVPWFSLSLLWLWALDYFLDAVRGVATFLLPVKVLSSLEFVSKFAAWEWTILLMIV